MSPLEIDADRAIAAICNAISEKVTRDVSEGVILGLSGGLDSSVLAALAVKALGAGKVTGVYLFDRDSDAGIGRNARLMAQHLGLELEILDISEEMKKSQVYKPLFIKLLRLSPLIAKLSAGSYRVICGESPFKSTLRVGRGEHLSPWYKRLLFGMTMHHVDSGFAARHKYRRVLLERLAMERNLSLIGAANLSEFEVGWFVKDGIDDLPFQPLTGLYKTQVRQLAKALALPSEISTQLPSPDMAKGVTDEFGIGHDYSVVDQVIDGVDRGMTAQDIATLGIPLSEITDIQDLMQLSDWKRQSPHEEPAVDGKLAGGLRRTTEGQGS